MEEIDLPSKTHQLALLLYNTFLLIYSLVIKVASVRNNKARLWINGRKDILKKIQSAIISSPLTAYNAVIWMHCASLGEFEQGRPLLDIIRRDYPQYKIVITFFSPSGYEIRKDYEGADYVFYLPIDSSSHAKDFLNILRPALVLWVKYEFWHYYLTEIKKRNIPLLLISGAFRNSQPFFKWYGGFWKDLIKTFTHIFLQNESSKKLLEKIKTSNVSVSGDTRFDRVTAIAETFIEIPAIAHFCGTSKVVVAGSTWEDDEVELIHYVKANPHIKFIIAPHEVDEENVADVKKEFAGSVFYSEWLQNYATKNHLLPTPNCLIIDNIGMLSRLYKYAHITYVGGGFNDDGLHNILEAAVYGKPVIFGPDYKKNSEAEEMIQCGGAISIDNALQLEKVLDDLLNNEEELKKRSSAAKKYVYSKTGATEKIMRYIQENLLLTN